MGFNSSSTPANNTVTAAMLQAGSVTLTKLASGVGAGTLLSDDETETTGTGTNASVKSFALPANTYTNIFIEAEVTYDYVAASDELTWDILVGGVSKRSMSMKTGSSSGFTFTYPLRVIVGQQGAATIAISVTLVVGNPTWRVRSLRVWGIL